MAQKKITLIQLDQTVQDAINAGGAGSATQLNGQPGSYYLARANHTGTQAIATIALLQDTLDGKAAITYVDSKVAALVNSSPAALDTLKELADAIGDDPNFATTVTNSIAGKLAKTANLSDLTSVTSARTNLGLAAIAASGAYTDLSGRPDLTIYVPYLQPTATKTAAYTAVVGDYVIVDASAGNVTITLPVAAANQRIAVKKIDSSANTVTVQRSGSDYIGSLTATSLPLTTQNESATYLGMTGRWNIENGHLSRPALDLRYYLQGSLATVATSGSYNDLTNKPTIPPALSLTTTGTSGAATYNASTGALNIPQYSAGGGGGTSRSIATITANTTAGASANTDYVYFINNATLTLPTAVGNTNSYKLKNINTTVNTIATTSSQTIDGGTLTLAQDEAVELISDNANWRIM